MVVKTNTNAVLNMNANDHYEVGEVVVAGHICLDIIPRFPAGERSLQEMFIPGTLIQVEEPTVSLGGVVSNTGLALHNIGVKVHLIGKVGADIFGSMVRELLSERHPALSENIITSGDTHTSYTIVINPPRQDRIFLHAPGANNTFSAADLFQALTGLTQAREAAGGRVRHLHFGYPPIMAGMYADGGRELVTLFSQAKEQGLSTSLDMAMPDPDSAAGKADWRAILQKTLPFVDVFLPSAEEMLLMLHPALYAEVAAKEQKTASAERAAGKKPGSFASFLDAEIVGRLGAELIAMGAKVVGLKLGDQGFYLRTGESGQEIWAHRELWTPCFAVQVAGATGAGDATVAGFLAAYLEGRPPEAAMEWAVAVGACSVEAIDATSGIPRREVIEERLAGNWARLPIQANLEGWRPAAGRFGGRFWVGPADSHSC